MEAYSVQDSSVKSIHWKQLSSLAALYGSIIIGWIAYKNYQPKLLVQFQFTDFSFLLTIAEAVIVALTPPIAGRLGDRFRFAQGHRIPIISSGISFAAMIFMAVAFTLFANPGDVFKWILPILIVFWLIAMSIFTSPALSTVELFTPIDKLPRAMAVLTIVSNLLYALEPVIVDIIDYIKAPTTFVAGGVVTFISGYALRKTSLDLFSVTDKKERRPSASFQLDTQRSNKPFIFLLGIVLGVATTIMFNLFPAILEVKLASVLSVNGKLMLVYLLVVSAILSWPVSIWINKYGVNNIFRASAAAIAPAMAGIFLFDNAIVVLMLSLVYALMFTGLSVSALPLAINRSNYYEKVFCVGIFFSGVAIPDGIMNCIQAWS